MQPEVTGMLGWEMPSSSPPSSLWHKSPCAMDKPVLPWLRTC